MSPRWRQHVLRRADPGVPEGRQRRELAEPRDCTHEKVARVRGRADSVLMGHVPYAIYRTYMPADARFVTMMRDPVDRVSSHYFRHLDGERVRGSKRLESITHALELGLLEVTNLATRFLSDEPSAEPNAHSLEEAKRNLQGFAFVGFQERFEESVVMLHRALGLDHLVGYGPSRHVNEHRPSIDQLSDHTRRLIIERNALDVALFSYARQQFDRPAVTIDGELSSEVAKLREMRAPLLADYATQRRQAAAWLDRQLPPGTTRPLSDLNLQAVADGIDLRVIRDAIRAMRGERKAVLLVLHDERRFILS